MALNLPLTLGEGKNVLLVTAADPEGNTVQAARTVFYDRPPPSPSPPTRPGSYRDRLRTPAIPITTLLLPPQLVASVPVPPLQMTISSPRDEPVDQGVSPWRG